MATEIKGNGQNGELVTIKVDESGAVDINLQDQTTDRLSLFLGRQLALIESLSGADKDADTFNIVTDGTVPQIGNFICMQELQKITQEEIIQVTPVAGNEYTIKIAVPLDFAYTTEGSCSLLDVDMNVNGSLSDQVFAVGPKQGAWDITRMIISMVMSTAGDDGLFGNLDQLANGQYFRKEDSGDAQNLFIAKDNSDFAIEGYDLVYQTRSGGGGSYGLRGRITFAGQDKSGVVIRLNSESNDTFKSVIRDDLTGLVSYRIKVQGHVVED